MKTFQVNSGLGVRDFDSQSVPVHDVISLAARITGTEIPKKDFKEGSIPRYWIGVSAAF